MDNRPSAPEATVDDDGQGNVAPATSRLDVLTREVPAVSAIAVEIALLNNHFAKNLTKVFSPNDAADGFQGMWQERLYAKMT